MSKALLVAALSLIIPASTFAADNLQLNRRLDYSSDSRDGRSSPVTTSAQGCRLAGQITSSFTPRAVSIPSGRQDAR